MATTERKYLSLEKLGLYDQKIKALMDTKDKATLDAAKGYADGLATNYDAAGSAATALENAKKYADGKDEAIAAAKKAGTDAQAAVDTLSGKVGTVADDKTVVGLISEAKTAADAAQGDVDALETLVGTIPEGATAKDIVGYVNEKTTGIAKDTDVQELKTKVGTNTNDIAAIKADYLKTADKTALQGSIDEVSGKVTTLIGEDASKSVREIANEELVSQLIPEDAKESLNTLQEIAAWIQGHPDDASAMNQAITALQKLVGTIPTEGVTATDIVGYIQEVIAAEKQAREAGDGALDTRVRAIEGKLGDGDGSVSKMIENAKNEAITTAAEDATTKANAAQSAAEATAKAYTDTEVGKDRTRIDAVERSAHSHANKELLDTYTQTEVDLADAVTKKHSHAHMDVIEGITAEKVAAWDKVGDKADQTALQAEIDRAQKAETANAEAIAAFVEISEADINALFAPKEN